MVKLVDTSDLKSAAAGRAGSIPARGTISLHQAHPYMSLASNETLVFFAAYDLVVSTLILIAGLGALLAAFAIPGLPSSIADLLKKLRVRYSHLRLHVSVRKSMQIESGADSGEFDIGLSMRILDGRSLPEGLPVRREALRWVSVAGFEAELEEDTPLPLLVLPQGCSLQRLARETLEAYEVPYVVAHSASGVAGLQSALLAGLGVACLNASAVPMGAEVCRSAQHLPVLPDVEFSLLPPRPGESQLVSAVREMLASQFS